MASHLAKQFTTNVQRAWSAVKAATMTWVGGWRTTWYTTALGRTRLNYAGDVGDGRGNAIVVATIQWMARTFPEAPLRVQARQGDELTPQPNHPMLALLDRPNAYYSGILLWYATIADYMATGNAYWLKVRSGAGRPVELWWIPSGMIEPKWPDDGSEYLSHYEYRPNATPIRIEPTDVVHFRYGLDPANMRKGLSMLAALVREVFTDDEASNFSASLLRNLGVPGVVVSPEAAGAASIDDLRASKQTFMDTFGGDRRGEPLFMSGPTKVQVLSFNPEQMDLKTLRRLPEERVTAVFGIPAIVVGLGAGLDRSTFANYAEAREAAYEGNVIPTQRLLAAEIKTQLLVDYGDTANMVVDFDLSGVRVLQDDQNALANRLAVLYEANLIRRSEARQLLGQMSGPEDEAYKSELTPAPPPMLPPGQAPPAEPDEDEEPEPAAPKWLQISPKWRELYLGQWQQKAFGSDDDWYDRAASDVASLTAAATPMLDRLFARTGRAVIAALPDRLPAKAFAHAGSNGRHKAADDDIADLVGAAHEADLTRTLRDVHEAALGQAAATVADGLGVSFQLPFAVTDSVLDQLATRIVGIADTTRDDVRRIVRDALDRGATIDDLRDDLRGLFTETYRNRSRAIARTESGFAYNAGTVASYRESGLVESVRVHDGDEDEPCASANGSTWTLERAGADLLGHPNCVRAFSPVVGE